jgi:prepilin-type N-terminal cleavage/methylation domain-containing protein
MVRRACQTRTTRRCGFTLLELLIVAMLGTLVIGFLGNAWRWYARSINDAHISAQLSRELKLAAEAIAQDYGPALAVRGVDGTSFQFDIDSSGGDSVAQWDAPDTVIEYIVQGGNLVRRNLADGTEVPMAGNITDLSAQDVEGHLNVHLVAGYRTTEQDLTLVFEDP